MKSGKYLKVKVKDNYIEEKIVIKSGNLWLFVKSRKFLWMYVFFIFLLNFYSACNFDDLIINH